MWLEEARGRKRMSAAEKQNNEKRGKKQEANEREVKQECNGFLVWL
jgi:hypothetical protein